MLALTGLKLRGHRRGTDHARSLSAQATSTSSERTFSQAGLATSDLRKSLKADTLCIYLRMNKEWLQSLDAVAQAYCEKHGHKFEDDADADSEVQP